MQENPNIQKKNQPEAHESKVVENKKRDVSRWVRWMALGSLGIAPLVSLGCATAPDAPPRRVERGELWNRQLTEMEQQQALLRRLLADAHRSRDVGQISAINSQIQILEQRIERHMVHQPMESFEPVSYLPTHPSLSHITMYEGALPGNSLIAQFDNPGNEWTFHLEPSEVGGINSSTAAIRSMTFENTNTLRVKPTATIPVGEHHFVLRRQKMVDGRPQVELAEITLEVKEDTNPAPVTFRESGSSQLNYYTSGAGIAALNTMTIAHLNPQENMRYRVVSSLPAGVRFDEEHQSLMLEKGQRIEEGTKALIEVEVIEMQGNSPNIRNTLELNVAAPQLPAAPRLRNTDPRRNSRIEQELPNPRPNDLILGEIAREQDVAYVMSGVTPSVPANTFGINGRGQIVLSQAAAITSGTYQIEVKATHRQNPRLQTTGTIEVVLAPDLQPVRILSAVEKRFNRAPAGTELGHFEPQRPGVRMTAELLLEGQATPTTGKIEIQGDRIVVTNGQSLPAGRHTITLRANNGIREEVAVITVHVRNP